MSTLDNTTLGLICVLGAIFVSGIAGAFGMYFHARGLSKKTAEASPTPSVEDNPKRFVVTTPTITISGTSYAVQVKQPKSLFEVVR